MNSKELVLRVPHSLGAAEAKRRISARVDAAKGQFRYLTGLDANWRGNRLDFKLAVLAQSMRGAIDVEETYVVLRAELPFVIRSLAARFVPIVQTMGQKLLTK